MTKLYHVNPETGRANICRAENVENCPFGSAAIHSPEKKEAQRLYESSMQDATYTSFSKDTPEEQPPACALPAYVELDDRMSRTYTFPDFHLNVAQQRVDEANKKLERYGIEERFELIVLEETTGKYEKDGITLYKPTVTVALNRPKIGREGYEFIASSTATPDGKLVIAPTGDNKITADEIPHGQSCDHCGHNRRRERTYLIRDPEGNVRQIGSTCLDAYMGVEVKGLWVLEADPLKEDDGTLHDEEDEDFGYGSVREQDLPRDTEEMMAYALVVSENGKNFISRNAESYLGEQATVDHIDDLVWGRAPEDEIHEVKAKVQEYIQSGKAKKALRDIKKLAERNPENNYFMNLHTIAESSMVRPKHMGLFVSSVSALRREELKQAEKAAYVPGFAGQIRDKMKGRKGKVKKVRHILAQNYYTGQEEYRTVLTFLDEEGHEMVWFASKEIDDVEAGDAVSFTGGTIKEHGSYQGRDQTVLTRVKFETADDE